MKTLLTAAGVLLLALLAVYFFADRFKKPPPSNPKVAFLVTLADLADRSCLSNTSDSESVALRIKLQAVGHVDATAGLEQQRTAARGAAEGLAQELKRVEDDKIRTCMEPWAHQIRTKAAEL
jgi:hypothetical protein